MTLYQPHRCRTPIVYQIRAGTIFKCDVCEQHYLYDPKVHMWMKIRKGSAKRRIRKFTPKRTNDGGAELRTI